MRRPLVTLVILLLAVTVSEGQLWKTQRLEVNGGMGFTQILGDIGGFTPSENFMGFKDLSIRQTRFNVTLGGSYRVTREFNARLNLSYARFNSSDVRGSNIDRGFIANTRGFETSLLGEYYFLKSDAENSFVFSRKGGLRNRPRPLDIMGMASDFFSRLDMYGFAGFGVLSYSVKPNDILASHNMKDGGLTMVFPVGLGAKYLYSPEFNYGIEFGLRYALTDYLEGYTSQFSNHNDVYYFLNVTVAYKFATLPRFLKRR